MKKIKLTVALLIPLSFFAQETVPASGGDASGSGGAVAYSIGQVVYTTNTGTNGNVSQGVQQPYEIYETTGLSNNSKIKIELVAYPNPTKNNLTLRVEDNQYSTLSFELYDLQGKILDGGKLTSNSAIIKMEQLPRATYILKVTNENTPIKTFQIIKN